MRRYRSSCRPAFVSKNQLLPTLTIGTGNGQSCSPTIRLARVFVLLTLTLIFARAWAANAFEFSLSRAGSPVCTMSSLPGPSISFRAAGSYDSVALIRASAAACAVAKALPCAAAAWAFAAELASNVSPHSSVIAPSAERSLGTHASGVPIRCDFEYCVFIFVLLSFPDLNACGRHHRRRHDHRRHHHRGWRRHRRHGYLRRNH